MGTFGKKLGRKLELSKNPAEGNERNGSLDMSMPTAKTIHGIEIRKMPIGAYMRFVQKGSKLASIVMEKLFPGADAPAMFAGLMSFDKESLVGIITELMLEVPELVIEALAELLGCSFEDLYDNPEIGPNELMDIWDEWNKINDLTGFFVRANKRFPLLSRISSQAR